MRDFVLAQLNIAELLAPIDSPRLADFVGNLERINALAEQSPGFVWRLQTDDGDATALRPFGENCIVNMSVWQDVESLHHYVFHTAHLEIMRRRKEWFGRLKQATTVMWWIQADHIPTVVEAKEKLGHLRAHGPTAEAFTFKRSYPMPGSDTQGTDAFEDACPAL
ncbi:MAG: DUF3291 domain-containing protein [Pseudomonadota bacterium]